MRFSDGNRTCRSTCFMQKSYFAAPSVSASGPTAPSPSAPGSGSVISPIAPGAEDPSESPPVAVFRDRMTAGRTATNSANRTCLRTVVANAEVGVRTAGPAAISHRSNASSETLCFFTCGSAALRPAKTKETNSFRVVARRSAAGVGCERTIRNRTAFHTARLPIRHSSGLSEEWTSRRNITIRDYSDNG